MTNTEHHTSIWYIQSQNKQLGNTQLQNPSEIARFDNFSISFCINDIRLYSFSLLCNQGNVLLEIVLPSDKTLEFHKDQSIYNGHRKCSNAMTSYLALGVCLRHSRLQGIAAEDMLVIKIPI